MSYRWSKKAGFLHKNAFKAFAHYSQYTEWLTIEDTMNVSESTSSMAPTEGATKYLLLAMLPASGSVWIWCKTAIVRMPTLLWVHLLVRFCIGAGKA